MAIETTDGVPVFLTAGDAASFRVSDSTFAAPDWSAQLVIHDSAGNVRTFDAADDGSGHLFTLSNANTLTLKPGAGKMSLIYSDGTHRQSAGFREIFIMGDPTKPGAKSTAQKIVDELEAAILKVSGSTNAAVSFNGHSYTKKDLGEMTRILTFWKARVIRENALAVTDSCRGYRRAKCGGRVPWA